jgi:large subunit ribosomal protein L24
VQTTLLGLAIAFILALLAALIGPYFVDWSRFRPQFQAEATRVIGLPVRVEGTIDARLLPTPSLRLRDVSVGARFDESNAQVSQLDVEFSLGSLVRGDWRANELTLNGLAVDLGLDDSGRMEWASRPGMFNFGALTVDRLKVTGSLTFKDAASRTLVSFDDVAFKGDVRTNAGAVRGDGTFVAMGSQYPFRLSTGRVIDGGGLRVHLAIDPGVRPIAADLEGSLTFDDAVPRFDGALSMSRPIALKQGDTKSLETPWKITSKLKADPTSARFEQVELSYGPDDAALKLGGIADLRLGASPLLHGVLTARQLDADRVLARADATPDSPLQLLRKAGDVIAAAPLPPLPVQLEASADLIMLGGRPIQNVGADLRSNGKDWSIDHLELHAPGATEVAVSGRVANLNGARDFGGDVKLDSSDPDALFGWLRGRTDAPYLAQKPIQAQGRLTIARDRVAVDSLKAMIDGHDVTGNVALATIDNVSKLDATLAADALDWTTLSPLLPKPGNLPAELPQEMRITLDIGSVTAFDHILKPVKVQLASGPKTITIDRLRIGSADGVMVEGNGAFDRPSAAGQLNLSTSSSSLEQIGKLVTPLWPKLGQRITALPTGAGNVWLGLTLALDKPSGDRANLRATLELDSPALKGSINAMTAPTLASFGAIDADAIKQNPFAVTAKLSADHGAALMTALGLDDAVAVGNGAATLDLALSGAWQKPLAVKATLAGRDLDATAEGTAEPWQTDPVAALNVALRKANIAPLTGARPADPPVNVAVTSLVDVAGNKLTLTGIDATFGASRLRGRLGLKLGDELAIDGELGADMIDIPSAVAVALGSGGRSASDPFGRGLLRGWRGRIAFQSLRGTSPFGEVRPLAGTIESDGSAVTLESLTGTLAGGKARADVAARRDSDGIAVTGHLQLSGADGAQLRYRNLAMPAGRVAAELSFAATGRSASALLGAMSGSGSLTLENAHINGVDPNIFQIVADAGDANAQLSEPLKLKAFVDPLLIGGTFVTLSAELPIALKDGQLRVAPTRLNGNGVQLVVSGGYNLSSDQIDLRAVLSPSSVTMNIGGVHPEIQVLAGGTPDALARASELSALSSWLTLRAVDRETKRLEAIERNAQANRAADPMPAPQPMAPQPVPAVPPPSTPAPAAPPATTIPEMPAPQLSSTPAQQKTAVPALPPPVEIKPAPAPLARPQQPKARPPLALTPPQ